MRFVVFLAIILVLILPFNWLACRELIRIHPRRRRLVLVALLAGNLLWPFLPFLRMSNPFMRAVRAVLGPPWFAWLSFTIVYSGVIFLTALVWFLVARRRPFAEFARWPSRVFLALTLAGSVAGFYQALVPLRVARVTVPIRGLPAEAEGMRIALLGDLHVGLFTRRARLDRIFATTASLNPDLVVLAGDSVDDDPWFVPKLLRGTQALGPAIPLIAVLGNHEMYGDPLEFIERLRGSRIRLLVNDGFAMRGVWIGGISDFAATTEAPALKPDFDAALRGRGNATTILVAHQPKAFAEARRRRVPLTLVAHTHGGQMGFRPAGWSLAGVFLPYHMGYYRRGDSQLYVNTGTGYWLLPFRLGMTPEITLIELHRNDERGTMNDEG